MNPELKKFLLSTCAITVGIVAGLKLNELINKAKTVPPATTTKA